MSRIRSILILLILSMKTYLTSQSQLFENSISPQFGITTKETKEFNPKDKITDEKEKFPLFLYRILLEGTWKTMSKETTDQFNQFKKNQGNFKSLFLVDQDESWLYIIQAMDGVILKLTRNTMMEREFKFCTISLQKSRILIKKNLNSPVSVFIK